ncbi:hypothetical protein SHKM778_29800 [Streptomyces sp. KM77-8]|uniref:Acyl-CoA dehydrogenase/oxidase C-terminal domain-containing protein n=1 Tax=Streptomyces haneummycinicus TaxID=3074435 RepID=A0AAT9HH10_9ACTN
MPRVLEDGTRNVFLIQRLKDKLGNRSNASAEVEFAGTWARRVGEEGRGVSAIIGMVAATRLDCVLGSAGLMRQAVAQAVHHATYREAFGGKLVDKPLMRNVLADLALESEAATTLALRLAAAYDDGGEGERALLRIAVPAAKYWVTKRCAPLAVEAAECLGGNGYVEESGMPRLVRESPLNSIWEGAGNVQALDVLRALRREPAALDAYLREVGRARGADHRLDAAIKNLLTDLADLDAVEGRARRLVERLALTLQASLLVRHAPPEVSDAFCASRLSPDSGTTFGTLPHTLNLKTLVTRAHPTPEQPNRGQTLKPTTTPTPQGRGEPRGQPPTTRTRRRGTKPPPRIAAGHHSEGYPSTRTTPTPRGAGNYATSHPSRQPPTHTTAAPRAAPRPQKQQPRGGAAPTRHHPRVAQSSISHPHRSRVARGCKLPGTTPVPSPPRRGQTAVWLPHLSREDRWRSRRWTCRI